MQRLNSMFPREGRLLLVAAFFVIVPGWIKGINLLLLLGFLLLGLWVVNCVAAGRQVRHLRGVRRWLGPVFAGTEGRWDVELQNDRGATSLGFRLKDTGADHRQVWFINRMNGERPIRLRTTVTLPKRGRYPLAPLEATCLFPFGLARRSRFLTGPEECIVLPRLGRLNAARFQRWLAKITRGDGRMHRLARPSMIHQDDLHGLRPFRPGDNPRWIHWRTSARRNQKMVREFEEDTGQNLIIVLEPYSGAPDQPDAKLELAISLAATIAWEWSRQCTDYLMLAVAGTPPVVRAGHASRDGALDMLHHLALTTGAAHINAAAVVKAVSSHVVPEAPVLVVAPRVESQLYSRLVSAWNRPVALLTPERAADFFDAPRIDEPALAHS